MQMTNYHLKDFHDFSNAFFGGGPQPAPATLSFRLSGIAPLPAASPISPPRNTAVS